MSKPRWEEKFENYEKEEPISKKIENLSKEIEEMKKGKVTGKFATKEEYEQAKIEFESKRDKSVADKEKDLEGYKNYEKNKTKINNVWEYRKLLEGELEKLPPKPEDFSKQLEDKKNELETSKKDCDRYIESIDKLNKELDKAKVDKAKEEKAKIAKPEKINELQAKINELQAKIGNERKILRESQDKQYKLMPEIQDLQDKQKDDKFADKRAAYERKIAKCNILAANLLKGKELGDIELKVETRKFDSKDDKIKQLREYAKKFLKDPESLEVKEGSKDNNTLPEKVDEFAKKHPRLAKIGNFFKNIKNKVVNAFKGEESKSSETEKVEKAVKEELDNEDKALFEIAEKGHSEYIKSLREATKQKLEAAKQKAANEYAERYHDAKGNKYHHQDGANVPIPEKKSDEPER